MQTFLSDTNLRYTTVHLDNARANRQLLEGRVLLGGLLGAPTMWSKHPAFKMWKGYEGALFFYLQFNKWELERRGIAHGTTWGKIVEHSKNIIWDDPIWPWWMRDDEIWGKIVASHRGALYRKKPEFYTEWGGYQDAERCCKTCNYFWPTHLGR